MGLFEGRHERKAWRAALENARRAEAVGNVAQMQRSIRAALALRSAVPEAWLDELRDTLAGYQSTSYGARALTFAALRAESSLDLELAMRWRAALGHVEAEVRRIEGNSDNVDLDPVLQGIESVLSLDRVIPWEMKEVDVPPVWEGFLRAAQLTAERGYAVTSLRVLQSALPLAESLPAQCGRQLSEVASTLEAKSIYTANRKEFSRLSKVAREVAGRTVDRPPSSRPPHPARTQPDPTPSPPAPRAARAERGRVDPERREPASAELDSLLDALGWAISQSDTGAAETVMQSVENLRRLATPAQEREITRLGQLLGTDPSPSDSLLVQVDRALSWRRFGEASRLIRAASIEDLDEYTLPARVRELPGLAPWTTVIGDLNLGEPPKPWDPSEARTVRIRWASRLRWPALACVVITADAHPSLIVRDLATGPESKLTKSPIELIGSIEECVHWGKRILSDRRLFVGLADEARAWSKGTTLEEIAAFVAGTPPRTHLGVAEILPPELIVDARPGNSDVLRLAAEPGGDLRLANRLEDLVLGGDAVDASGMAVLRDFLVNASMTPGVWGPFKGIIKALETRAAEFPVAFGTALARITCLSGADPLPNEEAMSVVVPGDVRGRRTLAYLDRRGRRVLRTLSWRDPATYAAVVVAFLSGVDELLAQGNRIQRRHALDFSLYGAARPVAPHMRFPGPPAMPQRHQQRWDPAPDAWTQASAEVSALLAHTTTSADIATWAFQVLTDLGADVPVIHAAPALVSGNVDFQRMGVAVVAGDPTAIDQLSPEELATLIARMPVEDAAALLARRVPAGRLDSVFEALLVTPDQMPHLAVSADEHRRVAMLAIDMASPSGPVHLSAAARVAVLKAAILWGESGDLTAVASGLPLEELADLRQDLGSLPDEDTAGWLDDMIIRVAHDSSWQTYSLATRWVESSDPDLSRLGWRFADVYLSDDSGFLAFVQGQGASPAAVARCIAGLAAAGSSARTRVVLGWWAQTADERLWEESAPVIDRALAVTPQVWPQLWPLLSEEVHLSTSQRLRQLPSLPKGMVESVAASLIASFDDRQTDALWSFLTAHPQRFEADDEFALAVTVVPNAVLCSTAISILRSQNRVKDLWLPLIESGLPPAVAVGEQHLRSLTDKDTLRASMLDLLDSGNRDARTLAMTLLSDGGVDVSWTEVLDEMTEHRDPRIWREVADRLADVGDQELLQAFQRRVLTTRREGRAAKTLVQQHLTTTGDHEDLEAALDILFAMAQGDIPRDREWAVSQLLTLAESGHAIPGLDVIDQAG